jgi:hypothetical protein
MSGSGVRALLVGAVAFLSVGARAQMAGWAEQPTATLKARPASVKIAEALTAGPAEISKDATVVEYGENRQMITLRKGTNGWTCMPDQSETLPPMCMDQASMQWMMDFGAHKPKPTNTVPGITYMLAGATQRSDSDPFDKTSPLIKIGPHWMIMWPFDPKATGLPTTHRPQGTYIMWAGNPYAHVHVMGNPSGALAK